ncbi:MAG: hypothetical protein RLZZ314_1742 [Bacteroidota bacterium]|jgi:hypothetical protein
MRPATMKPMRTKTTLGWPILGATLFLWSLTASSTAQDALDLPGMAEVVAHHNLSVTELNATWRDHARDAVMISQGFVEVAQPKEGLVTENVVWASKAAWTKALLDGVVRPNTQPIAYPLSDGSWVVLASEERVDRWLEQYLLNAEAWMK